MSNHSPAPEGKDPILWEIAQKRASFKTNAITYIIVNGFLWALWFTGSHEFGHAGNYPWPLFSTIGWGIGLAFHFAGAFVFPKINSVENEYQKLKSRQQ